MMVFQKREREIQQKLEEREEKAVEMEEGFQSLQQEVEIKTKKLKKVSRGSLCLPKVEGHKIKLKVTKFHKGFD